MNLCVEGLSFSYNSVSVLDGVSLGVEGGEVVSLVGPNGSGKSTLLKCINRILKLQRGSILLKGKDIRKLNLKELAKLVGYVPQSSPSSFPLSVFDVVLLGRKPYIHWGVSKRDREIVAMLLRKLGIEELAMRNFNELSGGERQKVLLARALAQQPEVLLLDEPTSNLDLKHQLEVLELIRVAVKEKGISAIIAIHDLNLASRFSDRIILLNKGRIYALGEPNEIFTSVNIKAVYGVKAIINQDSARPYIIPVGVEG